MSLKQNDHKPKAAIQDENKGEEKYRLQQKPTNNVNQYNNKKEI